MPLHRENPTASALSGARHAQPDGQGARVVVGVVAVLPAPATGGVVPGVVTGLKQKSGVLWLYPQTVAFPPQYCSPAAMPSAELRQIQPDEHFCGGIVVGVVATNVRAVRINCGTLVVVNGFS